MLKKTKPFLAQVLSGALTLTSIAPVWAEDTSTVQSVTEETAVETSGTKGLTNLRKKDIVNETNKIVNNFSIINYAFLIRIRHQMLSFQFSSR